MLGYIIDAAIHRVHRIAYLVARITMSNLSFISFSTRDIYSNVQQKVIHNIFRSPAISKKHFNG